MVGAVAEDSFGDVILDRFKRDGVGADFVSQACRHDDRLRLRVLLRGRIADFRLQPLQRGGVQLTVEARLLKLIADGGVSWFHVSGSSLGDPKMAAAILKLFDAVRAGGGKISYDPNVRKEIASNPDYASHGQSSPRRNRPFPPK